MRGLLILAIIACCAAFAPPQIPKTPRGFNVHCDVCETMIRRTVPYCERDDQNLDYLPDFCTFNYNRVLRTECDYMMQVMEFAWCPSACEEVRKLKSFAATKICHHPLVNCTERAVVLPSPSPSPSPSTPVPTDCVLCEFVLKHVAIMCMNNEHATGRNIYHVCMQETKTKQDFEHCQHRLHELVALAGTVDPCTMLSCAEPKVTCRLTHFDSECHVVEFNGNSTDFSSLGLDQNGNLLKPEGQESPYPKMSGLGPGDFRPGQTPYHALNPRVPQSLPSHVRLPGHFVSTLPVQQTAEEIDQQKRQQVEQSNTNVAAQAEPTPIPLKDIKMQ